MRRSWRKRHRREPEELDIKTFMNLMVILVPFLLITAVFSQTAVIELNLPVAKSATEPGEPEFALEVIVRANQIEVGDRSAGVFSVIPMINGVYDVTGLTNKLKDVKATFPDQLAVTLLLESDIDYESMVQIMDAVRSYRPDVKGEFGRAELFPEISIGDAPLLAAATN
jgi:biopolymer transport protein ExbD